MTATRSEIARAFGWRVGREASVYFAGAVGRLVVGLAYLAVLTRLLAPPDFGRFALLMLLASFLSALYGLGISQGTLNWAFGASGPDDETAGLSQPEGERTSRDARKAIGTGLVLTAFAATLGTVATVASSELVASALLGDQALGDVVILAALAGAAAAVWRVLASIPRMERRPRAFAVLGLARPLCILTAVLFLASEGSLRDAVLGFAVGSGAAVVIAAVYVRASFRLAVARSDASEIFGRGRSTVPVVVSTWSLRNLDLLFLAVYVPKTQVALYRVASRIAVGGWHGLSALLSAWGPLMNEPVGHAVRRAPRSRVTAGSQVTYVSLAAMMMVGGLGVLADVLVRIAPAAYDAAAPLIPLVGLGFAAHAVLLSLQRTIVIPRKRRVFTRTVLGCALAFLLAAFLLIPPFGTYGAGAAVAGAWGIGIVTLLVLSQRGAAPLVLSGKRLMRGAIAILACVGLGYLLGRLHPAAEVLALPAMPLALVAAGVVPSVHVRGALRLVRRRAPSPHLEHLSSEEISLLRRVLMGKEADVPPAIVGILARSIELPLGNRGASDDVELAHYLVTPAPVQDRDRTIRRLMDRGHDPLTVDVLVAAVAEMRRWPAERWLAAETRAKLPSLPSSERTALELLVRRRLSLADAAQEAGLHTNVVSANFVAGLRSLAGVTSGGAKEEQLARRLLKRTRIARRSSDEERLRTVMRALADLSGHDWDR